MILAQRLHDYLNQLKNQQLLRQRQIRQASINFISNDYLGLANHPELKAAHIEGIHRYPVGSGGSMLVCGYQESHQALEAAFRQALQVDACLLFTSGYAANLSVMRLLAYLAVTLVFDKAVHASLYDGLSGLKAKFHRFFHNDVVHLKKILEQVDTPRVILTEGIFSMSGQAAPLKAMAELLLGAENALVVDEAHAFGVMGPRGLGATAEAGLSQEEVPLRIIPFGKALGGMGAIVAGQSLWIESLLQIARANCYSTAMSPAYAHGLLMHLEQVLAANDHRERLRQRIAYFRVQCQKSGFTFADSTSAIQQLRLGCPAKALHLAAFLQEKGIVCAPMRVPTVTSLDTGLRIVLRCDHQFADIAYLFECLKHAESYLLAMP